MILVYMASPYTHKSARVRHKRFVDVTKAGAKLKEAGFAVVLPITTSVPMVKYSGLKSTWEDWKDNDLEFLSCCDALVVLKLDGWKESIGVKAEMVFADQHLIPIFEVENTDEDINRVIELLRRNAFHLDPAHPERKRRS